MKKVKVLVSFPVTVEYEDDEMDEFIIFDIEENGCPGTGRVGASVYKLMEKQFDGPGVCQFCPEGTNKILEGVKRDS